ncbi:hypothetical protein Lsan_1076 [Legionella santicrucis]|uniref:Uncharacterized protein n=1 Tax=Legionella santicrucis TaxID=45074 RepID=A0A0W0Z3F3_9GAMM|nr:hypothetical protein [Legionella santicrucis]KTD63643.1 hypothetical protein Lsan_1076 [Legionella santicrucis]
MKLMFSQSFLGGDFHDPIFMIKVAREGGNMDKHDAALVEQLNAHGLASKLVTAAIFDVRDIESGQSCFGNGYFSVPKGYKKAQVKAAFAKLDGLTVEEVSKIWIDADKNIANLIHNLSNNLTLSNQSDVRVKCM